MPKTYSLPLRLISIITLIAFLPTQACASYLRAPEATESPEVQASLTGEMNDQTNVGLNQEWIKDVASRYSSLRHKLQNAKLALGAVVYTFKPYNTEATDEALKAVENFLDNFSSWRTESLKIVPEGGKVSISGQEATQILIDSILMSLREMLGDIKKVPKEASGFRIPQRLKEILNEPVIIMKDELGKQVEELIRYIEDGKEANIVKEVVDINILLKEVRKFSYKPFTGVEINVQLRLTEAPLVVNGVKTNLQEAFLNIFKNGLESMPQGGTLTFTTEQEGDFAKISISDTGIGMSEEHRLQIFNRGFTEKPEGLKGEGIGLDDARKAIESHGGRISVKSELNKGTTFVIYLPISEPKEKVTADAIGMPTARRQNQGGFALNIFGRVGGNRLGLLIGKIFRAVLFPFILIFTPICSFVIGNFMKKISTIEMKYICGRLDIEDFDKKIKLVHTGTFQALMDATARFNTLEDQFIHPDGIGHFTEDEFVALAQMDAKSLSKALEERNRSVETLYGGKLLTLLSFIFRVPILFMIYTGGWSVIFFFSPPIAHFLLSIIYFLRLEFSSVITHIYRMIGLATTDLTNAITTIIYFAGLFLMWHDFVDKLLKVPVRTENYGIDFETPFSFLYKIESAKIKVFIDGKLRLSISFLDLPIARSIYLWYDSHKRIGMAMAPDTIFEVVENCLQNKVGIAYLEDDSGEKQKIVFPDKDMFIISRLRYRAVSTTPYILADLLRQLISERKQEGFAQFVEQVVSLRRWEFGLPVEDKYREMDRKIEFGEISNADRKRIIDKEWTRLRMELRQLLSVGVPPMLSSDSNISATTTIHETESVPQDIGSQYEAAKNERKQLPPSSVTSSNADASGYTRTGDGPKLTAALGVAIAHNLMMEHGLAVLREDKIDAEKAGRAFLAYLFAEGVANDCVVSEISKVEIPQNTYAIAVSEIDYVRNDLAIKLLQTNSFGEVFQAKNQQEAEAMKANLLENSLTFIFNRDTNKLLLFGPIAAVIDIDKDMAATLQNYLTVAISV